MKDQFPLAVSHPCVTLAHAAHPVIFTALVVAPEWVNVHYGKGCIPLIRDLDLPYHPPVVNESVRGEQLFLTSFPAHAMEPPEDEDPGRRIVVSHIGGQGHTISG